MQVFNFFANLPADTGNQRLGPDLGDDEERFCCSFGFYVLVTGHQVIPFSVVLWVQSVNLVGCLDYFSGHQAWLTGAKTIHTISKTVVCIMGSYVVILLGAVWGGTAGAMPRDQPCIPVHFVGAFSLWGGRAGTRPGGR